VVPYFRSGTSDRDRTILAMTSAPVAALVVLLTLSAVLLASGVAKLRDPRATRDAFIALRVPDVVPAGAAARALPWAEIALAGLLLLAPDGWLLPVAVALALLMLTYTWLIARALGFEEPVSCSCFGSLGRHDVDRTTLIRNVLLSALAVVTVAYAVAGGSAPSAFADLDRGGWWALIAAATAAAVAVLVFGGGPSPQAPRGVDTESLDYERQPNPYGVLTLPDGQTSTLNELASTQAQLLVILNPGCGPCIRIAEKLDDWAARLSPAVGVLAVYPSESGDNQTLGHSRTLAAVEPERNVRRVLGVGTPSAVLVGADGFLAGGPVAGEDVVADFVEDVLAELDASVGQSD